MKQFIKNSTFNKIKCEKGITTTDMTLSIIIIVIFTSVIAVLMSNMFKMSLEIQKAAEANAYATIILEKVDEKKYEDIDENFINKLKSNSENEKFEVDSDYTFLINVEEIEKEGQEKVFKKVTLKVNYNVNGNSKSFTIDKLKVKEIGD